MTVQFKIVHLKSKTNNREVFDATEELRSLIKQNGLEQLDQAMKNEQGDSLAFQMNLFLQEKSQFIEKDQNFFLGNNVDQQK